VQEKGEENVYLVYASTVDDLKRLITDPPKKPTPTPTNLHTHCQHHGDSHVNTSNNTHPIAQ